MKKGKMVLIAAGALLLGACQEKNAEIQDSRVMPGSVLSEETQAVMSRKTAGKMQMLLLRKKAGSRFIWNTLRSSRERRTRAAEKEGWKARIFWISIPTA